MSNLLKTPSNNLLDNIYKPLRQKNIVYNKKKRLIAIAGPTAVGKTELSLEIAKIINGEIVSADSMQVYRGMDIGTAKVDAGIRQKIPHHVIDIRDVSELFNVCDYYKAAHMAIKEIFLKEKVPIVVGGSGFYLHTLLYGPPEGPSSDAEVRKRVEKMVERMGSDVMYEKLQMLDPEYAKSITEKDKHKIVRAFEIMVLTKKKVSEIPRPKKLQDEFDFRCWFLYMSKEKLYQRLDDRCDEMLKEGLLDEVRALIKLGLKNNITAAQAIGYRQSLEFLETEGTRLDYEEFVKKFKRANHQYVKRQFTWFKKETIFRWLDIEQLSKDRIIEYILQDFEQGI